MITNEGKVRSLPAASFGVSTPASRAHVVDADAMLKELDDMQEQSVDPIGDDDPIFTRVQELLGDGFAGVIFSGAPGTGKSWYAREIAKKITRGNADDVIFIQFHPGYQYDDFVEGYVSNGLGGFVTTPKTFLKACERAAASTAPVVLVIDELSRTDVVRVFGETFTYLETSKRGLPFTLASGNVTEIPPNLVVLATMNPWDRGVDELDLAFERRFAKIRIDPSADTLKSLVDEAAMGEALVQRLIQFFRIVSNHRNPLCRIGHAYFLNVNSVESLRRVWDNQLSFHYEKILRHDDDELATIRAAWNRVFE